MRISPSRSKRWLALPIICLGLAFYAVQICAQRPAYWQGDYSVAWSWSPVYRWTMSLHPAAFLGQGVVEVMLLSFIILLLPLRLSAILSTWVAMSYTLGTASWLRVHTSYWLLFSLVFVPAILIVWSHQQTFKGQQTHGETTSDSAPSAGSEASHA